MKAIVYEEYGSPDVLELKEVPKPIPKSEEVLIKVRAASVNSWDWDLVRGKPFIVRMIGGGIRKPKLILGADIAGIVEAVGNDVTDFQVGDEVFGDNSGGSWGGFAEFACVPADMLAMKSSKMSFEQAAATPQAGVLALQGLRDNGKIKAGDKVLLNGAGGGVGTFALQIAKSIGAEVTCVDVADKLEMLASLGADYVIDYTKEDFTKSGKKYDVVIDVVAYKTLRAYKRSLTSNGIFVFVGGSLRKAFLSVILTPWHALTSNKKLGILAHKPNREDLEYLNGLFEEGKAEPIIDSCFPLSQTANAIRVIAEGRAKGKVIVTV